MAFKILSAPTSACCKAQREFRAQSRSTMSPPAKMLGILSSRSCNVGFTMIFPDAGIDDGDNFATEEEFGFYPMQFT